MEEADVELIRDVARGDTRDAVQALKEKIIRESIYKGHIMES
jgi:hypothetical protein